MYFLGDVKFLLRYCGICEGLMVFGCRWGWMMDYRKFVSDV